MIIEFNSKYKDIVNMQRSELIYIKHFSEDLFDFMTEKIQTKIVRDTECIDILFICFMERLSDDN